MRPGCYLLPRLAILVIASDIGGGIDKSNKPSRKMTSDEASRYKTAINELATDSGTSEKVLV